MNDVFSRTCTAPSPAPDRAPLQVPHFSCLLLALFTPSCHLKSKPYSLQVHARTRLQGRSGKCIHAHPPRQFRVKGGRVCRPRVATSKVTPNFRTYTLCRSTRGLKHEESQGCHSVDAILLRQRVEHPSLLKPAQKRRCRSKYRAWSG